MKRMHALLIAAVVGIAVVLGSFAALRSTQLAGRGAGTAVSATQIAKQNRALDRAQAALRAELRRKPPALAETPAVAAPTIVYHRPPAIVHIVHRHGGEHETEGGDRGEGIDD